MKDQTNWNLMKECDCMKKVWTYFAIGCVVAIIGMFFSDICGDFFNGMDYGSACVLGIGMYLCVRRDLSRYVFVTECAIRIDKQQK